jgi:hypothetical protein
MSLPRNFVTLTNEEAKIEYRKDKEKVFVCHETLVTHDFVVKYRTTTSYSVWEEDCWRQKWSQTTIHKQFSLLPFL